MSYFFRVPRYPPSPDTEDFKDVVLAEVPEQAKDNAPAVVPGESEDRTPVVAPGHPNVLISTVGNKEFKNPNPTTGTEESESFTPATRFDVFEVPTPPVVALGPTVDCNKTEPKVLVPTAVSEDSEDHTPAAVPEQPKDNTPGAVSKEPNLLHPAVDCDETEPNALTTATGTEELKSLSPSIVANAEPGTEAQPEKVNIIIRSNGNQWPTCFFQSNSASLMANVLRAYLVRNKIDPAGIRFIHDSWGRVLLTNNFAVGEVVKNSEPEYTDLTGKHYVIEAYMEQTGGYGG